MSATVVQRWLAFMESGDAQILDDLLDDDVAFYSPAVFRAQLGRAKTAAYLLAAEKMFSGSNFRYTGQWYNDLDRSVILQFTADLDGITVEGIDMIHWSESNKIVSFKVMVRPLKALQTVTAKMGALLSTPSG